jgi:hypothetical protein
VITPDTANLFRQWSRKTNAFLGDCVGTQRNCLAIAVSVNQKNCLGGDTENVRATKKLPDRYPEAFAAGAFLGSQTILASNQSTRKTIFCVCC